MLQFVRNQTGENLSGIIREGIRMKYNLERFKADDNENEGKKEVVKEPVKEPDYFDFVEDFDYGDEDDEGDFEERWGRF